MRVQGDVRAQLKVKDDKISEALEELAGISALYAEAKQELDEVGRGACPTRSSTLTVACGFCGSAKAYEMFQPEFPSCTFFTLACGRKACWHGRFLRSLRGGGWCMGSCHALNVRVTHAAQAAPQAPHTRARARAAAAAYQRVVAHARRPRATRRSWRSCAR